MRLPRALPALLLLPACVVQARQAEPPPTEIATTVYLMSGEGHTGLLLPDGEGAWVEYAFGDYAWYIHGRDDLGWQFYTAMVDTSAALGRRNVGPDPSIDPVARRRGFELYPYSVPAQAAESLRIALEKEYARGGEPVYNPLYGLHLVQASAPYSVWFNCTDATAAWLATLGIDASTGGICKRIVGPREQKIVPQNGPRSRPPGE